MKQNCWMADIGRCSHADPSSARPVDFLSAPPSLSGSAKAHTPLPSGSPLRLNVSASLQYDSLPLICLGAVELVLEIARRTFISLHCAPPPARQRRLLGWGGTRFPSMSQDYRLAQDQKHFLSKASAFGTRPLLSNSSTTSL